MKLHRLCYDSKDEIPGWGGRLCEDLLSSDFSAACIWDIVKETCPKVCNACCEDSTCEEMLFGNVHTCDERLRYCTTESDQLFCPSACGSCR
jgi:hypothetical protein